MTTQTRYPVIAVEGIIGAGKSTLCDRLERDLDLASVTEPVDENPYLDKFYDDQKRWALHMQMWLVSRRVGTILQAKKRVDDGEANGILIDSSLLGDRVFAELQRAKGNIDATFWPVYDDFFENMISVVPEPTVVVYLNVTPTQALKRVRTRGRVSENTGVTLEYLQDLKLKYDDMIKRITNHTVDWWPDTSVIDAKGYLDTTGVDSVIHGVADHIAHLKAA